MHYRADGGLDMRYSSSKAASSSSTSGGGGSSSNYSSSSSHNYSSPSNNYSSPSNNYSSPSNIYSSSSNNNSASYAQPSQAVHLTKAGNPDHRFAENRVSGQNADGSADRRYTAAAAPAPPPSSPAASKPTPKQAPAPKEHLKKDGTPDYKYKENRVAGLNTDGSPDLRFTAAAPPPSSPAAKQTPAPKEHLKKDGTPDYKYKENRVAGLNKDGSPDKRYTRSEISISKPSETESAPPPQVYYDACTLMCEGQSYYEDEDISNESIHDYQEEETHQYPLHSENIAQAIINSAPAETSKWDDSVYRQIEEKLQSDSNWVTKTWQADPYFVVVDATICAVIKKKRMKIITKKATIDRLIEQWKAIKQNGYPTQYVKLSQKVLSQITNVKGEKLIA